MKNLSLLVLILIFCQFTASSQTRIPCLAEGIEFNTQSQVDSFQINHPGCTEIEGYVFISGPNITNLNGLNVLASIGGSLTIDHNDTLTVLSGLDNLTSIGEDFNIWYNDAMTSLMGLDNLTSTGEGLYIFGNDALTSLSGLSNLTSIGGGLVIQFTSLTSLSGIDNVTSIGGRDLYVRNNDFLISLIGLDNIDAASIKDLWIYNNNSLNTCEVQSICEYLAIPGGDINIYHNAPGCNSQQEVEDACEALLVENINFEVGLSIYPNPANQEVFISSSKVVITEVTIYNQIGQKVMHHKQVAKPLDVSMLRQGAYIVEVCSQDFKAREKLIIR